MPGNVRVIAVHGVNGALHSPSLNWGNGKMVPVGAASAQSDTFNPSGDALVWVSVTTDAWITVGNAGAVTGAAVAQKAAGSSFIGAKTGQWVYVPAGQVIAVLQDSAGGFMTAVPALTQS